MSPIAKYSLGRVGLFVVVLVALTPVPLNVFVKLMIALFASAAFSFFLLRGWREQMAEQLGSLAQRRRDDKARLRAALAGDESAAARGDRAAADGSAPVDGPTAGSAGPTAPVDGPAT